VACRPLVLASRLFRRSVQYSMASRLLAPASWPFPRPSRLFLSACRLFPRTARPVPPQSRRPGGESTVAATCRPLLRASSLSVQACRLLMASRPFVRTNRLFLAASRLLVPAGRPLPHMSTARVGTRRRSSRVGLSRWRDPRSRSRVDGSRQVGCSRHRLAVLAVAAGVLTTHGESAVGAGELAVLFDVSAVPGLSTVPTCELAVPALESAVRQRESAVSARDSAFPPTPPGCFGGACRPGLLASSPLLAVSRPLRGGSVVGPPLESAVAVRRS
jgi:hypothetical protein